MPNEFSRGRRVSAQIRRELAPLIQIHARDAKLGMVTITAVDISPDLRDARVFVTAFGTSLSAKELIARLTLEMGAFRQHLARSLRLRKAPRLEFRFDGSIERAARLTAVLDTLGTRDQPAPSSDSGEPPAARKHE